MSLNVELRNELNEVKNQVTKPLLVEFKIKEQLCEELTTEKNKLQNEVKILKQILKTPRMYDHFKKALFQKSSQDALESLSIKKGEKMPLRNSSFFAKIARFVTGEPDCAEDKVIEKRGVPRLSTKTLQITSPQKHAPRLDK